MRAWAYALKQGVRALIAAEIALVISAAVVRVAFVGLVPPTQPLLIQIGSIAVIAALVVFPTAVVSTRYGMWRNNQVKPKIANRGAAE